MRTGVASASCRVRLFVKRELLLLERYGVCAQIDFGLEIRVVEPENKGFDVLAFHVGSEGNVVRVVFVNLLNAVFPCVGVERGCTVGATNVFSVNFYCRPCAILSALAVNGYAEI